MKLVCIKEQENMHITSALVFQICILETYASELVTLVLYLSWLVPKLCNANIYCLTEWLSFSVYIILDWIGWYKLLFVVREQGESNKHSVIQRKNIW